MKIYSKYNSYRKDKFNLITSIENIDGNKFVIKKALNDKAYDFLHSLKSRFELISSEKQPFNFAKILSENKDNIVFEYVDGTILQTALNSCLTTGDIESLKINIVRYIELLSQISTNKPEHINKFEDYFGEIKIIHESWLKIGYLDLNFDNFIIDKNNRFNLIDYEWTFDFSIPTKYVIFRAITNFYQNYRSDFAKINFSINNLYEWTKITNEEKEIFINYEYQFQKLVCKEVDSWYVFREKLIDLENINTKYASSSVHYFNFKSEDEVRVCRKDLQHDQKEIQELTERVKCLEIELATKIENVNSICNSTSWKITHPLRATVDTLKIIKKHGSRMTQDGKKGVDILRKKGLKEFTKKLIDYSKNSTQGGAGIQNNFDSRYAQLAIKKQFQNNRCETETLSKQPKISILMPVYNTDEIYLRKAIFSVINQQYRNWELCIVDDYSTKKIIKPILYEMADFDKRIKIIKSDKNQGISLATNQVAEIASGEYLLLLDHDDELTENALFEVVNILQKDDFDFIYSDDDKIDENGILFDPQFKPDWSPELLLSYCYISHLKVFKKEIWEKLGGLRSEYDGAQDYDLCLRLSRITDKVAHIPQVLYHWRSLPGSTAHSSADKPLSVERGRLAVESWAKEENIKAEATIPAFAEKNKLGIYEFIYNSADYSEPVTIIIPTKDKIDYLQRCIDSIKSKTNYSNYRILVINNNSEQASTVEYLKRNNIEYFDIKTDSFNFAQINNEAVKRVKSDLILFLNNDTEVINADWLLNMAGAMSLNNKIGAVGARLVFPDKRTQHTGVVMGLNNQTAGHAFKLLPYQDSGYLSYNLVMRNYSAVTAACLLTRKSIFDQVGGLDENNFAVGYNDVDYCLKLIDSGYRVVYQPQSILFHHEGGTRREVKLAEDNPREVKTLQEKWEKYIQNDPYYNPNLSLANEFFQIKY